MWRGGDDMIAEISILEQIGVAAMVLVGFALVVLLIFYFVEFFVAMGQISEIHDELIKKRETPEAKEETK